MDSKANLAQDGSAPQGPAYILEWTSAQQPCSKRHLHSAEELHASAENLTAGELTRRLFVVQGLAEEYVEVLRDELGVDARFIKAHEERRGYRPRPFVGGRRDGMGGSGGKGNVACFEYPELLSPVRRGEEMRSLGEAEAPVHGISTDGDVAVFCRASLWLGGKADVLLLDRPTWSQPSARFQKAHYRTSSQGQSSDTLPGKPYRDGSGNTTVADEIPSFESLLVEALPEGSYNDLRYLIGDIAAHQWAEFFEALSSAPTTGAPSAALYWQVQRSLEQNLSFETRELPESREETRGPPVWEALLARLGRHTALLSNLGSFYTSPVLNIRAAQATSDPTVTTTTTTAVKPSLAALAAPIPLRRRADPNPNPPSPSSPTDANQHSLDRVSYMGGVLLPLSIVSSILSMSDPFGPGGSMFFVFWAASIPLVVITVIIIYADSIRKAEVWIEVGASGPSSANGDVDLEGQDADGARTGRAGIAALGDEEDEDDEYGAEAFDAPGMVVEKLFPDAGKKKWHKEQLGWMGACKAVFRIYKLKKGRPPNWAGDTRHGRRAR